MASVNLKNGKCNKGKALYGIPKHLYRDGKNHSNKDIDSTRSHLNKHYGAQSSAEFRDRLREMIKAADEKHPPKRQKQDRKVLLMAVIPSPREGMTAEQEAAWSAKTWEVMNAMFDGQIVGATYHADEIHKYTPPGEKEQHLSRGHTHYSLLPWTEDKGLNMDAFYRRDLPNKINEALDKACMEMFGFPFRDGTGKKGEKTVEELKKESEIAALDMRIDDMQNKILDAQDTLNSKLEEAEEVYKPYIAAVERLMEQLEALTPKDRAKEKDLYDWIGQNGRVMGKGSLAEIKEATAYIERQSARLANEYRPIEDDDFER